MTVLTVRLPDDTGERLKQLASSRRVSVNKLIEELSVAALSAHDAEMRFRAASARADRDAALRTLSRLDETATS
ncbi:MAG: ribbon-helix-helix protein, CopG family [Caulobacteraceae bacterium]|nr:ribbon-helix-helix protein, CopG family [Caulobacteraceae bacterium]